MSAAVQVREIERELSRLWHESAGSGEPMLRACTLTLIVLAERERASDLQDVLHEVTRRHPARAILVSIERGGNRDPSASIGTMCALSDSGDKQVCHEQIELSLPEQRLHEIESLITPLFVPDVPAVLFTPDDRLFALPVLRQMIRSCDRWVLDSQAFENARASLELVRSVLQDLGGRSSVSDLNFERGERFRELVAQVFDVPDLRPFAYAVDELIVEVAAREPVGSSVAGALLAGWFASRLQWQIESSDAGPGEISAHAMREGGEVRLRLVPRVTPATGPDLLAVRFSAPGACFALEVDDDQEVVRSTVETTDRCLLPRRVRRRTPRLAELLKRDLESFERQALFEECLSPALALVAPGGVTTRESTR